MLSPVAGCAVIVPRMLRTSSACPGCATPTQTNSSPPAVVRASATGSSRDGPVTSPSASSRFAMTPMGGFFDRKCLLS